MFHAQTSDQTANFNSRLFYSGHLFDEDSTFAVFFTEKLAVTAKVYQLLEPLDRVQFSSVIAGCVEFCKQHLSADFSPLVDVLQVKNYIVSGDS